MDTRALRAIDANANRAREALRVMEDAARFVLDDAERSSALKLIRHDLAAALAPHEAELLASRDTPGDVGTTISTPAEGERAGVREVAVAAGKRLSEALRSIEEFAKTGAPALARATESLRYRAYEEERLLVGAMPTGRGTQWALCVLITESLCALPWEDVAQQALECGADCLQLREKDLEGSALVDRARRLVERARPYGASVIVNDRVDVALAAGADGVHLGQGDIALDDARRIAGSRLVIGVSTSTLEEAHAAKRSGADYCGIGPMFPTTTKHKPTIAGPEALRAYVDHTPALPPHLAIGGITPENAGELAGVGGQGIAVSSVVCGSPEPAQVTRALIAALRSRAGERRAGTL